WGLRTIELFRDGRRLMHAKVAVGAPGRETPLGGFYVTARFVPDDPFLGVFAVETSAYSSLTEWPGGGKVGIHGTSKPWLLGQAVSHGCVRISNATALALKRLAPVGKPISIVARGRQAPWLPGRYTASPTARSSTKTRHQPRRPANSRTATLRVVPAGKPDAIS